MCDICNRAKLFSKRVRSHRVEGPESDLPDPTKFGEQVAIDHMIVSKSSGGREFVVLLVYETFNGILTVYPASSKSSDFVYTCLKHFVGLRYQNPDTVCTRIGESHSRLGMVARNRDDGLIIEV